MAIRLSKIYTKTGDKGTTRLVGGDPISKTALRLECYGSSDELNSFIGLIRTALSDLDSSNVHEEIKLKSLEIFKVIQNDLFDLGSYLATPPDKPFEGMKIVTDAQIEFLEKSMDKMQEDLKPINSFTLPGGHIINAHSHVARTVCRRLERIMWRLAEQETVDEKSLKYINRLSDFLFVYSRWVMVKLNIEEYLWKL